MFSLSLLFSFSVCLSLSLSPPVSGSLSLHVCFLITISPSLSVSVSYPGQAGPGMGCGVTGRQGSCHLFSCPHWQGASWAAVQEFSGHPAPVTRHRSHRPLLPAHSVLSRKHWGRAEDRAVRAFLLGSSYGTACPGGLASHQHCPLTPPLPGLGLGLPQWGLCVSSSSPQGLCTCCAVHLEFSAGVDHTHLKMYSLSLGQNAPLIPQLLP